MVRLDESVMNHYDVIGPQNVAQSIALHEMGHALGLDHPNEPNNPKPLHDQVMSSPSRGITTPQLHDRGDYGYLHGASYIVHAAGIGDMDIRGQGDTGGTTGQARALEGVRVNSNQGASPATLLLCTAHVAQLG